MDKKKEASKTTPIFLFMRVADLENFLLW